MNEIGSTTNGCLSVVDSVIDSKHEKCRELFVSVNNYILSHAH